MKPVVLVPEIIARSGLDLLRDACDCRVPWEDDSALPNEAELRKILYEAHAVIVRLFTIDERDLQQAKNLRVIGKHGAGVDNIDCRAAAARNIPVVYTPGSTVQAVAEHALTLMLALARQLGPASAALSAGRFGERDLFKGVELGGKTLGLIGAGRIGSRLAQIAAGGLQMKVHAYDPQLDRATYAGPAVLEDSLEALLSRADFLSLHVPLTAATRHLLNESALKLCKRDCRIVNTSRGGVIDEAALAQALRDGALGGAALDVFEHEPPPTDHPLAGLPNVLLTPHIAGLTHQSQENTALQVAQGVLDVLNGRAPGHVANPEVFP